MFRIPLIALVSLALAAPAFAQSVVSPVKLEDTAVKIMLKAFQVGDYDTVEMLFDKLPLESKEQFLHQATEIVVVSWTNVVEKKTEQLTAADMMLFGFCLLLTPVIQENIDMEMRGAFFPTFMAVLGDYVDGKQEQTQLLGHLGRVGTNFS